jgi:hypothetical protein
MFQSVPAEWGELSFKVVRLEKAGSGGAGQGWQYPRGEGRFRHFGFAVSDRRDRTEAGVAGDLLV